jgi:hypothetical protein
MYNITVGYIKENDGQAEHKLYINGTLVDSWTATLSTAWAKFTTRTISNVTVNNGDIIKITGKVTGGSHGRMDYVELTTPTLQSAAITQNLLKPESNTELKVYPNPVSNVINFDFSLEEASDIQLSFYNINGQIVKTIKKKLFHGNQHIKVDVQDKQTFLRHGVYLFQLRTKYFTENGRFILNIE